MRADHVALLKACAEHKDLHKGVSIHAVLIKEGLLEKNLYIASALIAMYAKCGALAKAQQVLDKLLCRDVVSWNGLITGYAHHGCCDEALNCVERMQSEGLLPNEVTFACVLKACGSVGAADKGEKIHVELLRWAFFGSNVLLGNALIDMYVKCGELAKAQRVLDELLVRNVVSFSTLIVGYARHSFGKEALSCFERMRQEGLSPNEVSFICILKACGSMRSADRGEEIYLEIVSQGLFKKDIVLGNALVDMYAKCGALGKAQNVLSSLPNRDVITWNTIIAGYAQYGHGEEALNCFEQMKKDGVHQDIVTFICILKACGTISAVEKGEEIYNEIVQQGWLLKNTALGNAVVDMYSKCGALSRARRVLEELPVRNVVSWSALIAGYAQQGHGNEALKCFERMVHEGLCPNYITFASMLHACSHAGLVEEGEKLFMNVCMRYSMIPDFEHQTCIIDLFARAGHFDKAMAVIRKMSSPDYLPAWVALLGACRKWVNLEVGKFAFKHAVCLDAKCAAAYLCMNQIYLSLGMLADADKVEAMRVQNDAFECNVRANMNVNVGWFGHKVMPWLYS